jgi:hypothetical protein
MNDGPAGVQNNGWRSPVAPFITYPVQNMGWGKGAEPPPYQSTKMVPTGQMMLGPSSRPVAQPPTIPAPVPVVPPPVSPTGPLPVQDWFNLLMKG